MGFRIEQSAIQEHNDLFFFPESRRSTTSQRCKFGQTNPAIRYFGRFDCICATRDYTPRRINWESQANILWYVFLNTSQDHQSSDTIDVLIKEQLSLPVTRVGSHLFDRMLNSFPDSEDFLLSAGFITSSSEERSSSCDLDQKAIVEKDLSSTKFEVAWNRMSRPIEWDHCRLVTRQLYSVFTSI